MGANRITAAEITFYSEIVLRIDECAAKGTGSDTSHAANTTVFIEIHCSGLGIASDGINKAGFGAGRLLTLQAGNRHPEVFKTAIERIDATQTWFALY